MARRNMRMEEYLELVYQWHRGRSIRQIRDSFDQRQIEFPPATIGNPHTRIKKKEL